MDRDKLELNILKSVKARATETNPFRVFDIKDGVFTIGSKQVTEDEFNTQLSEAKQDKNAFIMLIYRKENQIYFESMKI